MSIKLKIKSKHLSTEPAIIRTEERKISDQIKHFYRVGDSDKARNLEWKRISLENHRKTVVRDEARATFLARGFIKGLPFSALERNKRVPRHIIRRIEAMVQKYHDSSVSIMEINSWIMK